MSAKRLILFVRPKCIFFNFEKHMSSAPLGRQVRTDNKFYQKYVRVSILGASNPTGEATAFLLKQNPLISRLYLHGSNNALGIAADLKHFDTRCKVKAYTGEAKLSKAIRRSDIIIFLGVEQCHKTVDAALRAESDRVVKYARACAKYSPKAIILVCVNPIACTLPLVAAVFKTTHWYHPGRIIGSPALCQIRANALAARFEHLDPVSVHVPMLGGPDMETTMPLFSHAEPITILPSDCEFLYERMQELDKLITIETPKHCKVEQTPLSEAYAINQMVTTMAVGLCGDDDALCSAFVRQNIIPTCKHLVTTVKFGPGGVVHNYGIPHLEKIEVARLEKMALILAKREKMTVDLFKQINSRESRAKPSTKPAFMPYGHKGPAKRD